MKAKFVHRCTHVLDKEATIKFYEEALGMKVLREMGPEDGSWANTFMGNDGVPFEIELTWNRGRVEPYENGSKAPISLSSWTTLTPPTSFMKRWVALFARTLAWAFISSPTPRVSGLRFCLPAKAKLTTE